MLERGAEGEKFYPPSHLVKNPRLQKTPITAMSIKREKSVPTSIDDSDPEEFDPSVDHAPSPVRLGRERQMVSANVKSTTCNPHANRASMSLSDTSSVFDPDDDTPPSPVLPPIKRSSAHSPSGSNLNPLPIKRSLSRSSSEFDPDDDTPPSPVNVRRTIVTPARMSLDNHLRNDARITGRHTVRQNLCASPEPGVELSADIRSMYALEIWHLRYNSQWFKHRRTDVIIDSPPALMNSIRPAKTQSRPLTFAYLTEMLGVEVRA